ncbi:unnamed protein product [Leuciscus chuanchicus]
MSNSIHLSVKCSTRGTCRLTTEFIRLPHTSRRCCSAVRPVTPGFTGDMASMSNPLLGVHPQTTMRCRLDLMEDRKNDTVLEGQRQLGFQNPKPPQEGAVHYTCRRENKRTHHTCTHPALIALIAEPLGPEI